MSEMSLAETVERFEEGLKKAASRARELAKAQKDNTWDSVAAGFERMLTNGRALYKNKALSRTEVLAALDRREIELAKVKEADGRSHTEH